MPSIALKIATFTAIAIAVTTMPGQAADGPQPGLWKVSLKTQGPGAAFDASQHHNGTFKMSVMAGPMPMEIVSPQAARASAGGFIAGIMALICACFVVPQHMHDVLGVRRLHEFIARSAAGFMAIGMLTAC